MTATQALQKINPLLQQMEVIELDYLNNREKDVNVKGEEILELIFKGLNEIQSERINIVERN